MNDIRTNWTSEELQELYDLPFFDLMSRASARHRKYHDYTEIQLSKLISVKTGGCPEDCKYCPQSSHYKTYVEGSTMLSLEEVIQTTKQAILEGATRICIGMAQRSVRNNAQFDRLVEMVREISALGVEVCCTLGMINQKQLQRLKKAGLFAYNHNLDTSRRYYPSVTTTRKYDDRLETLDVIQQEDVYLCCGGIMGMGETIEDRLELVRQLATREKHPQSFPVNRLFRVKGTPYANLRETDTWEIVRIIAVGRIAMPKAMIRLSAGRDNWSLEQHALCFLAGANSIFLGAKCFTIPNSSSNFDEEMLQLFGMKGAPSKTGSRCGKA